MAEKSQISPHIKGGGYTPLETLITRAIRRYGDFSIGVTDPEVYQLFLDFANNIVEEIRQHPYWDPETELNYYVNPSEIRPIPDEIMVAGLLFFYATQQQSVKANTYGPLFFRAMNTILWNRKNGNTKIQARVVDGGSNPDYSRGSTTNEVNGLVTEAE